MPGAGAGVPSAGGVLVGGGAGVVTSGAGVAGAGVTGAGVPGVASGAGVTGVPGTVGAVAGAVPSGAGAVAGAGCVSGLNSPPPSLGPDVGDVAGAVDGIRIEGSVVRRPMAARTSSGVPGGRTAYFLLYSRAAPSAAACLATADGSLLIVKTLLRA